MSSRVTLHRLVGAKRNRGLQRILFNGRRLFLGPDSYTTSACQGQIFRKYCSRNASHEDKLDARTQTKATDSNAKGLSKFPSTRNPEKDRIDLLSSAATNKTFGIHISLSDNQERAVSEHRRAIENLKQAIAEIPFVETADTELLRSQLERLDDGLFLLVVVGEYNSGKSSCINALLGRKVMAEGLIPTTAEITIVRYGKPSASTSLAHRNGITVVNQDIELLKTISLVDSPGTNAIDRRHEALTKQYLPLCDFVLFMTSADRPFSESERLFLKSIREWGKKCIVVVNKADLLPDSNSRLEVLKYVKKCSREQLGNSPQVFAVSSRQALDAKIAKEGPATSVWDLSGFEDLELYIAKCLDATQRLRIKLDSISSVGATIGKKYVQELQNGLDGLATDQAAVAKVVELIERCQDAVLKGFDVHFAPVDNALLELIDRADAFFDSHVTVTNFGMLLRKDAVAKKFADDVIQGTARDVEHRSRVLAEWVANKTSNNIAEAASIFSERQGERRVSATSKMSRNVEDDNHVVLRLDFNGMSGMEKLMTGLSDAASDLASSYDPRVESQNLAKSLSSTVTAVIAVELSAVGILAAWISSSMLDITGIASSGALATAGILIFPRRRHVARMELRRTVNALRTRLKKEVKRRVEEHMNLHKERVMAAVEPFALSTSSQTIAFEHQMRSLCESLQGIARARDQAMAVNMPTSAVSNESMRPTTDISSVS